MEGWEGDRVVSSLTWMPSEHPEVMVWLLVSVLTHESVYGCRPHGAPLNMFTYPLSIKGYEYEYMLVENNSLAPLWYARASG